MNALIRRPIAWLPIAIALAQLALIGWALAVGVVSRGDEGAPARIFQLLVVAETLLILAFAVRWVPRAPRDATIVLGVQVVMAAIPVVAILALEA